MIFAANILLDPFWMGNDGLHTLGRSAYNPNPGYKVDKCASFMALQVMRNVKVDNGVRYGGRF
jgi:hypothetical protein